MSSFLRQQNQNVNSFYDKKMEIVYCYTNAFLFFPFMRVFCKVKDIIKSKIGSFKNISSVKDYKQNQHE